MRTLPPAALLFAASLCRGAPAGDLVPSLPDYGTIPFKLYSGYINVTGPINGYDSLHIHYQFEESQGNPAADPLVTWHQGGPGSPSIELGEYTEMGWLHQASTGAFKNEYSWNRISNMLYLDSPAGVGGSYCMKGGQISKTCSWNDKTQAEAYAKTLQAFLDVFPEFQGNDLYLTGESYAGQYVPNIANYIANDASSKLNLKGFTVGNACWGGTETKVQCNGPNSQQNDVDLFHGKGLFSTKLYNDIYDACGYTLDRRGDRTLASSASCSELRNKMDKEVGPHNIYNIYDNCPDGAEWLKKNNKTSGWLRDHLRAKMDNGVSPEGELGGGYDWACGGESGTSKYLGRSDVREALHLRSDSRPSRFSYSSSGPASVTLYPSLIQKYRIVIYNGDADACVPYPGNEEWTTDLAKTGALVEDQAWHPWYLNSSRSVPAGYATNYKVKATGGPFTYVTIRLAGHEVPTYQPAAGYALFSNFLTGTPF